MPEIKVSGSLTEIHQTLIDFKAITQEKKTRGWLLFEPDEDWLYETRPDDKVCPYCEANGSHRIFRGTIVPFEFPDRRRLNQTQYNAEVHITIPWLRGDCRCTITFQNVSETLVNRLDVEFRMVLP